MNLEHRASIVTRVTALSAVVHFRLARFSRERIVSYQEPLCIFNRSAEHDTPASLKIGVTSFVSNGSDDAVIVLSSRGENSWFGSRFLSMSR